jgi:hypothetical protein
MREIAFLRGFILGLALVHCAHCADPATTPSAKNQADVALYGAELEACLLHARLLDAGLAEYQTCAHDVDVRHGRVSSQGATP